VEQTSSGRQGIELAAAQSFDLILLDLGMPEFDGFQTAAGLQQRLGKDTPPLVAITGFGSAADRARTQAAGFAEHLVKPVDPYTLSQALLRVLAVKQS
jgi:CheY-like chemotaxis protein